MKSYTDIEQSKRLSEILPTESADMFYEPSAGFNTQPSEVRLGNIKYAHPLSIPCWSLAALLDVLQKTAYSINEDANVMLDSYKTVEWDLGIDNSDLELITESNPIDACYEMIIKLDEQYIL